MAEHQQWATEGGPLMLSRDVGRTMLALFYGEPREPRQTAGHHRIAFRVNGSGFLQFLERLANHPVSDVSGLRLTRAKVVDHSKVFSIDFIDPYGDRYEITTYDYSEVV